MTLVYLAVRWSIYERRVFVDENFLLIYVLWKIEIWYFALTGRIAVDGVEKVARF